jgi:hypothetical protein
VSKLTATPDSVLVALDAAEADAQTLVKGLSAEQANWKPQPGTWSICECLDHLGTTNIAYAGALQKAVATSPAHYKQPTQLIAPGMLSRWFLQNMDAPAKRKFKAPTEIVPKQNGNPVELLQAFLKSHDLVREVVQSARSVDVNRLRFKNPFIGAIRFTVGTGLMIINAHDRRHLWQAEQVKKAAGYPAT